MTTSDTLVLLEQVIAERNIELGGKGGQAAVARELGCSDSLLNQVRKGSVPLSAELSEKIRVRYSGETVICPILGEITIGKCAEKRNLPFAATNPIRIALARACKLCDRRKS